MNVNRIRLDVRAGRIALGVALSVALAFGVVCIYQATRPRMAPRSCKSPVRSPRSLRPSSSLASPRKSMRNSCRSGNRQLAEGGRAIQDGGPFGAVIVDKDGNVIANGMNHVVANDPRGMPRCTRSVRPRAAEEAEARRLHPLHVVGTLPDVPGHGLLGFARRDLLRCGGCRLEEVRRNFDDDFIYEQFSKPTDQPEISEQVLLRSEAVEEWKEYHKRQDKVDY